MRGYSLLEVMLVVAIAAILTAVALPRISDVAIRNREPTEVVRVEQFLLQARDAARRLNRCVVVEKVDGSHLTATTMGNATAACPSFSEPVTTYSLALDGGIVALQDFVGATDATHTVFLRNGGTPYASDVTVTIDLKGSGRTRTLKILQLLGFVRQQ